MRYFAFGIRVEREFSLLNQVEGCHGRERLADRCRLKQGRVVDWVAAGAANSEASGPLDLSVVDQRDTYAGNIELLHPIGKRVSSVADRP